VSVISGATNAVIATVPVGNVPRGILFNPQNNRVYCSNYGSDSVSIIDGVTNAVIATVPVGDGPTAMGHNPVRNTVYVSNVGAPGPNTPPACTVSVISGSTNAVVATLPAGDEPTAFVFSSNDDTMYWINEWSHSVSVVDAKTDTPLRVISLGTGTIQPVDMCYNPVNGLVYTANRLTLNIGVISTGACAVDVDGNGTIDIDDLYRLNQQPVDVNADSVVNAEDISCLERFLRKDEIADMTAGRR
jgi:YVTN family beta-propeller protein